MTFISYAQNREDVMLWRALKHVEKGFYVDVGANDPVDYSVTQAFYERGWRGINIEPVRYWFDKLRAARPEDININAAVSNASGEVLLYEVPDTGLSTLSRDIAERHRRDGGFGYREITVPASTLDDILKEAPQSEIHFLNVDVEGAERQVLQGINLNRKRPWIILVEATRPSSPQVEYESWEALITDRGYTFVYFDGLNRFYVANEKSELAEAFRVPPNIFDNYIAVHAEKDLQSELWKRNEQLRAASEQLGAASEQLRAASEQLRAHNEQLRADNAQLGADKEQLRADNAQLGADKEQLRADREQLRADNAQLSAAGEQLRAHSQQREADLERAHLQHQELLGQIGTLEADIARAKTETHQWWVEADRWLREETRLRQELDIVYASHSWRFTAPLRALHLKQRLSDVVGHTMQLLRKIPGMSPFLDGLRTGYPNTWYAISRRVKVAPAPPFAPLATAAPVSAEIAVSLAEPQDEQHFMDLFQHEIGRRQSDHAEANS